MKPLRIAITADPYIPVPPKKYGGIERIIDLVARGLAARGHHVSLIAHPESSSPGRLFPYGSPPHFGWKPRIAELVQVGAVLLRYRREFDLVHSFGRLAALLPVLPFRSLPKIQSYHRPSVPWKGVRKGVGLAGDSICFTGCSDSVYQDRPSASRTWGRWHTLYNGVEIGKYEFVDRVPRDAPFVFLGKLEPNKGAHTAIEIARKTGRRLLIAGNRATSGPDAAYFERKIAPHLDGETVSYLGEVDDLQKNVLLGKAAALIFPTRWKEAFGIVMVEAMACGTPVIGFANGGVPEVIRDGVNGFLCRTADEAVAAAKEVHRLDRAMVRADCDTRFSDRVLVEAHENLYLEMVARCSNGGGEK